MQWRWWGSNQQPSVSDQALYRWALPIEDPDEMMQNFRISSGSTLFAYEKKIFRFIWKV